MEEVLQILEPAEFERASNAVDIGLFLLELFGTPEAAGDIMDLVRARRHDLSRELWDDVDKFLSEGHER